MNGFIEDEAVKPSSGRTVVRWVLVAIMALCVWRIGQGLYDLKNGLQLPGMWRLIQGSFFFILSYAAHWILRD